MFEILASAITNTMRDVLPVLVVIAAFQAFVLRERPQHLHQILAGTAMLVLGLVMFRFGIGEALLPIGSLMAEQLSSPAFVGATPSWRSYAWLYAFAAAIGFSATLIEPTLIAVAHRARDLTGGTLQPTGLRLVVATGVALGMIVGTLRIVTGVPVPYVFVALVVIVARLALAAPKPLLPLAFDSGGVATSVVIVPLIAGFSLSVAGAMPGRDALAEGFGLVMIVFLAPILAVLSYASIAGMRRRK